MFKSTAKKTKTSETGLEIIKASYGVSPTFADVTEQVKGLVQNGELDFTVSAQELGIISPAPGVINTLQIQYKTNGGKKQLLTADDKTPVLLSTPAVEDPPTNNYIFDIWSIIWFFLLAVCTTYFGMSAFRLGSEGFKNDIVGYILAILAGGTFIAFGASEVGSGVVMLLLTSPALLAVIPMAVFAYSMYNPQGIDFSYGGMVEPVVQATSSAAADIPQL
jgi:hypothetical protein